MGAEMQAERWEARLNFFQFLVPTPFLQGRVGLVYLSLILNTQYSGYTLTQAARSIKTKGDFGKADGGFEGFEKMVL